MGFFISEVGRREARPFTDWSQRFGVAPISKTAPSRRLQEQDLDASPQSNSRADTATPQAADSQKTTPLGQYQTVQERRQRRRLNAGHLMQTPVFRVDLTTTLWQAWQMCQQHRVRHLPVTDADGYLVAVISERDLMRLSSVLPDQSPSPPPLLEPLEKLLVQYLPRPAISTGADTPLEQLAAVMVSESIGCLPVVDRHYRVIGIVTRSDLMSTLVNRWPLEDWG